MVSLFRIRCSKHPVIYAAKPDCYFDSDRLLGIEHYKQIVRLFAVERKFAANFFAGHYDPDGACPWLNKLRFVNLHLC